MCYAIFITSGWDPSTADFSHFCSQGRAVHAFRDMHQQRLRLMKCHGVGTMSVPHELTMLVLSRRFTLQARGPHTRAFFPTLFSIAYPLTNANSRGYRRWPYRNRIRLRWWLATRTAASWDSSPVAARGRAGWATRVSFTRFISSSLHNGRASERCWYSISYVSFVHEASVRWPCGFWPRILLGNFMKPSEGKLSPNSRSNVGANRSQKALTVGKI
jgi:hypothetical protein